MSYSESLAPLLREEKKKQITIMCVVILLPLVLATVGFLLQSFDKFWALFAWAGAGATLFFLTLPKVYRMSKDDFFSHKIIYKGIIQDVRVIKMGAGTAAAFITELVLEKKNFRIGERGINELQLSDAPLPVQGEEVEIHALPKSGDVLKLLVKRNNEWVFVAVP